MFVAERQKQPKVIDGWMDKQIVVYLHNGIVSAWKGGEILMHATTWVNLQNIMLSERS